MKRAPQTLGSITQILTGKLCSQIAHPNQKRKRVQHLEEGKKNRFVLQKEQESPNDLYTLIRAEYFSRVKVSLEYTHFT